MQNLITIRVLPKQKGVRWMTWASIPQEEEGETVRWLNSINVFAEVETAPYRPPHKFQKRRPWEDREEEGEEE